MMFLRSLCALMLFSVMTGFAAKPATASEIVAVVNGAPITKLDLDQQIRLMRLVNQGRAPGRQEALQQLVDQKLKFEAANRMGMAVPNESVNSRLSAIAANTPLKTRERFLQGLRAQMGIQPKTIEEFIREQIVWTQIVRTVGARELNVRESEVDMFLRNKEDKPDEDAKFTEFQIQQIIIVVPGSSSQGQLGTYRRQAENVRQQFTTCEDMLKRRANLKNVVVKDIGWKNEGTLSPSEMKRIGGLDINKTSSIEKLDVGFEILAVCNKRSTNDNVAARNEAQATLRQEKGGVLSEKLIRDLRANAVIQYR